MLTRTFVATSGPQRLGRTYNVKGLQGELEAVPAIEIRPATSVPLNLEDSKSTAASGEMTPTISFAIPIPSAWPGSGTYGIHEDAAVIQIWEGTVLAHDEDSFRARLHAKVGEIPDHVGDIDLTWVSEQDVSLIRPGAVFYLTLYKSRRRGGTLVNSQELRFRRMPAWTAAQVSKIDALAGQLLPKLRPRPIAE